MEWGKDTRVETVMEEQICINITTISGKQGG